MSVALFYAVDKLSFRSTGSIYILEKVLWRCIVAYTITHKLVLSLSFVLSLKNNNHGKHNHVGWRKTLDDGKTFYCIPKASWKMYVKYLSRAHQKIIALFGKWEICKSRFWKQSYFGKNPTPTVSGNHIKKNLDKKRQTAPIFLFYKFKSS